MNENTLQTQSPVDKYIHKLIADITSPVPKNQWEEQPRENSEKHPQYRLRNADGNTVTLTCDIKGDRHSQYTLQVVDEEGNLVMKDVEWKASGYPSKLGTLYAMLRKHYRTIKPGKGKSASKYATPEQTDSFIQSLLRDAQGNAPGRASLIKF